MEMPERQVTSRVVSAQSRGESEVSDAHVGAVSRQLAFKGCDQRESR